LPYHAGRGCPNEEETAMTEIASMDLARLAADEYTRYFRHLASRVERAALAVPEDQLWIKPFPFGNSVGHLVLHLTGNLNHYIGALIAETGYVRHREHEFTDAEKHPRNELLSAFHAAVDLVVRTLEAQDSDSFATTVAEQPPVRTRLGLFLVCAAHLNNHIGQMSYLVQALQASTKEPPVW
jgi:hypothetical protein